MSINAPVEIAVASASTNGQTLALTNAGSAIPVGALVVIQHGWNDTAVATDPTTDSDGVNPYVEGTARDQSTNVRLVHSYVVVTDAIETSDVITVDIAANANRRVARAAYWTCDNGWDHTAGVPNLAGTAVTGSGTSSDMSLTTGTLSALNKLLLWGACASVAASAGAGGIGFTIASPGTAMTEAVIGSGTVNRAALAGYDADVTATTAYTMDADRTATTGWAAELLAFGELAAAGGAVPRRRGLLGVGL